MTLRILRFFLFRPAGLIALGVLFMGLGAAFIASRSDLPERAALKQVSGVLRNVQYQRKGNVTVSYALQIAAESGQVVHLILAHDEIGEDQVKSLLGRPVTALVNRDAHVWELASGTAKVIDYEAARRQEAEKQAWAGRSGPMSRAAGSLRRSSACCDGSALRSLTPRSVANRHAACL